MNGIQHGFAAMAEQRKVNSAVRILGSNSSRRNADEQHD